jgi:hypothetical protein
MRPPPDSNPANTSSTVSGQLPREIQLLTALGFTPNRCANSAFDNPAASNLSPKPCEVM